jgi:hypothetical protein
MRNDPMLWMPAADYAVAHGLTTWEVEHRLVEGMLEGGYDDGWYVARPLVRLEFPDREDIDHAELKLLAMPLGRYLTAARREFVIPIHRDDPDKDAALEALLDALQGDPVEPVPLRLNGRDWCVDSSLLLELAQALIEFESVHDRRVHLGTSTQ